MIYDVLVCWYTGWHRRRLTYHSRWHRGIKATSLTEASNIALSAHANVWNPQVSQCWPQWPQPKESL